jgi:hypothetical protein
MIVILRLCKDQLCLPMTCFAIHCTFPRSVQTSAVVDAFKRRAMALNGEGLHNLYPVA